jgi:Zn-dependent protease
VTAISAGAARNADSCTHCRTELAPGILSCPACHTLVHSSALKELAASAERLTVEGRLADARIAWSRALELLPPASTQVPHVRARIADLDRRLDGGSTAAPTSAEPRAWWKQGIAAVVTLLVFSLGKLKFLLLGLTKASTFFSMFAFFGYYWSVFGWSLAAGLVVSLYIHEMGHVYVLRRLGIDAGAPMFIPGLGAFVMLKQHVTDALTDAKIGLAGPAWGLGAGVAAYGVFRITGAPVWAAIAQLTGFLNLFNMIPIWQLDGSRGFHALSRVQRWAAVAAIAVTFLIAGQKLLVVVGAVAIFRAFQKNEGESHPRVLVAFVGLTVAHALLAAIPALPALP